MFSFAALFASLDVYWTSHQGRRQREEVKKGSPLAFLCVFPMKKIIFISLAFMVLSLCSCHNNKTNQTGSPNASECEITAEMAYEGVNNYCHKEYDWSIAEENPSVMYVEMGEETDSAYQVVFRSYTGALVCFYVDKTSGTTRMVERVPSLGVEEEVGSFELFDYTE